jgi:hypothetical protein
MFNKVLRRDGKEFTNCYSCSAKAGEARLATAANPTNAQVKKTQTVILAANPVQHRIQSSHHLLNEAPMVSTISWNYNIIL